MIGTKGTPVTSMFKHLRQASECFDVALVPMLQGILQNVATQVLSQDLSSKDEL